MVPALPAFRTEAMSVVGIREQENDPMAVGASHVRCRIAAAGSPRCHARHPADERHRWHHPADPRDDVISEFQDAARSQFDCLGECHREQRPYDHQDEQYHGTDQLAEA